MLAAARQAKIFISGRNRDELYSDPMLLYALLKVIEIIGEAARHISDDFKTKNPEIPWIDIVNMRNRLVHGYFSIDHDVVWETANSYIPDLIAQLEKLSDFSEISGNHP
jgi:uncharacterized protein with HEPN domain